MGSKQSRSSKQIHYERLKHKTMDKAIKEGLKNAHNALGDVLMRTYATNDQLYREISNLRDKIAILYFNN